jgi:hypothetical protein
MIFEGKIEMETGGPTEAAAEAAQTALAALAALAEQSKAGTAPGSGREAQTEIVCSLLVH